MTLGMLNIGSLPPERLESLEFPRISG
jgi:hypothetical protein